MSGNLINIYNLHYKIVVLKKNRQSFHKLLFQDPIWAKTKGQQRPCPKSSSVFFVEITRGDHKLSNQKLFISLKYHKFWLSYGWFMSCMTFCFQNQPFPAETDVVWQGVCQTFCFHIQIWMIWAVVSTCWHDFFWTPLESTFPLNDPWHFRQEYFSKIHGGHQLGRGLSDFTLTPIQRCTLTILMIKCKHNFKMSLLKNCKTYLHKIKSKWKLINTIFFGALFKNSQPN